jgi:hypothetical protein
VSSEAGYEGECYSSMIDDSEKIEGCFVILYERLRLSGSDIETELRGE